MAEALQIPRGGVDFRKYAATALALALVRGALFNALAGDVDNAQQILDTTATSRIAEVLGYTESDLTLDWHEHLTPSEVDRLKGF